MPPFVPGIVTESRAWAGQLEAQLASVRRTATGLSEEQLRARPTISALSVGGVVKHLSFGLRAWRARLEAAPHLAERDADFASRVPEWEASFAQTDAEPGADLLAEFDRLAAELLAAVRVADPDGTVREPAAPWFDRPETDASVRYALSHMLVEVARHAGHADIIREQLDGATSESLAGVTWEPEG